MEILSVAINPVLDREIENFQQEHGFENRSQATRALLQQGLRTYPSRNNEEIAVVAD